VFHVRFLCVINLLSMSLLYHIGKGLSTASSKKRKKRRKFFSGSSGWFYLQELGGQSPPKRAGWFQHNRPLNL
jgi:hypothetical protein